MNEDTYWFHLSMTDGSYNGIVNGLTTKFSVTRPDNILSEEENSALTQSLIKLVAESGWIDTPQAAFIRNSPALLRIFDLTDHSEAYDMTISPAWVG